MIIKPTDTVRDVLIKRAALFNLGRESITAQVMEQPVPKFVPRYWWRVVVGGYLTRSVGFDIFKESITMRELEQLQHFESDGADTMVNALSVMLRIPKRKVWRLQFITAYRYFLEVIEELKKVAQAFASLEIPQELKLPEDSNKYANLPSRGIPDLILRFTRGTQYTEAQAYNLRWIYVFRELQLQWEENCNKRKQIITERQEAQQRKNPYR